jgi:hypothetical protein
VAEHHPRKTIEAFSLGRVIFFLFLFVSRGLRVSSNETTRPAEEAPHANQEERFDSGQPLAAVVHGERHPSTVRSIDLFAASSLGRVDFFLAAASSGA